MPNHTLIVTNYATNDMTKKFLGKALPKSLDWGTCLCVTCLNPELRMEVLSRFKDKPMNLCTNLQELLKCNGNQLKGFSQSIIQMKGLIKYLLWTKYKIRIRIYYSRRLSIKNWDACSPESRILFEDF